MANGDLGMRPASRPCLPLIVSTASVNMTDRMSPGSRTSLISGLTRAGCIWRSSSICSLVRSSAGRCRHASKPEGEVIVHSDQGTQYTCRDWQAFLRDHRLMSSMSRRGNCLDNAVAESFFQLLKRERIRRRIYRSRDEARQDVFNYIELFYNSKRRKQCWERRSGSTRDRYPRRPRPRPAEGTRLHPTRAGCVPSRRASIPAARR